MASTVVLNGVSFSIPATGDQNWSGTGGVDGYLVAVSTAFLSKAAGSFTLTNEADFGGGFGLKTLYVKSETANPSLTGNLRLAQTDSVSWRNAANSADLALSVPASNKLQYNSIDLADISSAQTLTNKSVDASANTLTNITNAAISTSAAIAFSKLAALTSANIIVGNVSNVATAVSVTGDILLSNAGVTSYNGVVPLVKGGTGTAAASANAAFNALSPMTTGGDVIYGGASGVGTRLANGSAGQVLTSAGTTLAPTWTSVLVNPMTTGGDIIFGGAAGAATRLPNGTAGQVLQSNGTTVAPTWRTITAPTMSIVTLTSHNGGFSANATGTYTTPAGVLYLKVRLVGGGGGGGGSATQALNNATAGGNGGNSLFGTTLLAANGGTGGPPGNASGGAGGSASITGASGVAVSGTAGGGSLDTASGVQAAGGYGGSSAFGGGAGGVAAANGIAGAANSGSGGSGGGANGGAADITGTGGGSGGFVDAMIYPTASQTFTYTAGAAGLAGTAPSLFVGGPGTGGQIIVEEYYQ